MKIAQLNFDSWELEEKTYQEGNFLIDPDSFTLTIEGKLLDGKIIELYTMTLRWDEDAVDEPAFADDWDDDPFSSDAPSEPTAAYVWDINHDPGYAEYEFSSISISTEDEEIYNMTRPAVVKIEIDATELKINIAITDQSDHSIEDLDVDIASDDFDEDDYYEEEDEEDDDYYDSDDDDDGYF